LSRYAAAACHLMISLLVFAVLAWVILEVWYPDFFFAIDGGWEGMRIIFGVDVVLGPVLTLIVFRAGKPGLRFDLTLIGILQATCLALGTWIVYSERPIFFIYYDRHFYSSSADTFTGYGVPAPDPARFGDRTPAMVASVMPDNPIEEAGFRRILYQDNIPAWVYAPTFRPIGDHLDRVVSEGILEDRLRARDTGGRLDRWLKEHGGSVSDYAFIPIHSRYRDSFVGIRKSDRSFVDILEVPPPMSR